jgi:hypothetical protein
MLSADPTVPDPLNAQAWNRYSYVGNDPLTFTDPTGFSWLSHFFHNVGSILRSVFSPAILRSLAQIVVGAVLSLTGQFWAVALFTAWTSAIMTGIAGGGLGDMLRAGIISEATAWAFYGVGSLTSALSSGLGSWGTYVANVAGHAAVGCLSAVASGGRCGPGGLAAGAGAAIGPVAAQGGLVGGSVISGLVGGLASRAGGGKFEDGAVTAAFGYLFTKVGAPQSSGASPPGVDGLQPTLVSGTDIIQVPTQIASNGVFPVPESIYETLQDLFGSAPLMGSALKTDLYHAISNDFRPTAVENGTYFYTLSNDFPGFSLLLQYGITPPGLAPGIVEYLFSLQDWAITHQTYIPNVPITGFPNNWSNNRAPYGGT